MDDLIINLNDVVLRGKLNNSNITVLFKIYFEDGKFIGKDICNNTRYRLIGNPIGHDMYDTGDDFVYFSPVLYEDDGKIYTYEIDVDIASEKEINSYIKRWQIINYINENVDILLENDRIVTKKTIEESTNIKSKKAGLFSFMHRK